MLESAPNLRDLGGLRATYGRRLRSGLLYRSQALDALSDAEVEVLGQLGIRVACDLRRADERARYPNRWPADKRPEVMTLAPGRA